MTELPFAPYDYAPEKRITAGELAQMANDFRKKQEDELKKKLQLLKPHMALITSFTSSWDDITLSRFNKYGLNDEIKFAYWDVITTNRNLLNTIQ